jgi:hypothetical protein
MVVARRASEVDVEALSVLLADAFVDDAMLTWTFPPTGCTSGFGATSRCSIASRRIPRLALDRRG